MCGCYAASHKPRRQKRSPHTTLAIEYPMAVSGAPFWSRLMFSRANAEKVVNPPQKPVASNSIIGWDNAEFSRMERPNSSPIRKDPAILIPKVATGSCMFPALATMPDIMKRTMLPAAPPIPTSNNVLIFNLSWFFWWPATNVSSCGHMCCWQDRGLKIKCFIAW